MEDFDLSSKQAGNNANPAEMRARRCRASRRFKA
jgi:hypothetical protein